MTENDKRRFDSLSVIEDKLWREVKDKVKHEWKLSFSIWGAQMASVVIILGGKVKFGKMPYEPIYFTGLIIFILILLHMSFLYWIQLNLQNRWKSIWNVRKSMEQLSSTIFQPEIFNRKIRKQVSMYVQICISFLLGTIFLVVVSALSINVKT